MINNIDDESAVLLSSCLSWEECLRVSDPGVRVRLVKVTWESGEQWWPWDQDRLCQLMASRGEPPVECELTTLCPGLQASGLGWSSAWTRVTSHSGPLEWESMVSITPPLLSSPVLLIIRQCWETENKNETISCWSQDSQIQEKVISSWNLFLASH